MSAARARRSFACGADWIPWDDVASNHAGFLKPFELSILRDRTYVRNNLTRKCPGVHQFFV